MSMRPGSSGGARLGAQNQAAAGRPPGTATRLTTGQARPGSRGGMTGGGVALSSQVQVSDRPLTQQGLGGMKTAAGPRQQRQVMDKTYFVGLLRSKINELSAELGRIRQEVDSSSEEQGQYVSYEKRAEQLANELKENQGELADYNTLVDKLNTDESINDIQMDQEELKGQNDREARSLESLFDQKKQREHQIQQLEVELQQERSMTDNMVADMKPEMRQKYMELKNMNVHYMKQLETFQQELDSLNVKKAELEEELAMSPVKQEAVRLYEQLHELEDKRDQLLLEAQSRGTPQEEREKLLKQVKEDNQEIASMDRQSSELKEKSQILQDDIRQLEMDIEENQGERNQKYKELKKREESMQEFMETFEETKAQDLERISQTESNIVMVLEHMSRNLARFHHLPSPQELSSMKDDLAFKENEMKKSEHTASGLAGESEKLAQDLQKVEQLESKITTELDTLKARIEQQQKDIQKYSNLDQVRADAEDRKNKLSTDKVVLHKRKETFKKVMQQLAAQYEALKAQLNENETYTQLGNLERKWQHHEQNNFVMKEFIATKSMETDYQPISRRVEAVIETYNKFLQEQMSGKSGLA